ncbi:MAG: nitroreductase family deazaflavin-dependent oxidoreductase [Thaumarchaeota archaeon]|nr:nitroreductase family deazaflavin-dependent oxidoreductase [Nitrososphaerota archaeon]
MEFNEGPLRAVLSTKGRKTGKEHSVELRAVFHNNRFYFSRRNQDSDWLKNAIAEPRVSIAINDLSFLGRASLVKDEELAKKISSMKYSDKRSEDLRIVLEVIPDGLS